MGSRPKLGKVRQPHKTKVALVSHCCSCAAYLGAGQLQRLINGISTKDTVSMGCTYLLRSGSQECMICGPLQCPVHLLPCLNLESQLLTFTSIPLLSVHVRLQPYVGMGPCGTLVISQRAPQPQMHETTCAGCVGVGVPGSLVGRGGCLDM